MRDTVLDIIEEITGEYGLRDRADVDLVDEGILDSLAFIELINEMEERLDIEIQPTQIPADAWRSVDGIVKIAEEKKGTVTV